jgi:hypothetical protein
VRRDVPVIVDPLPPDAGWYDPLPYDASNTIPAQNAADPSAGHWRDTSPRGARRTQDLPLWGPPEITLSARWDGDAIAVRLDGGAKAMTVLWHAEGPVEQDDRAARWTPASNDDQLRVAVRTRGGIAVVTVRAADCPREA